MNQTLNIRQALAISLIDPVRLIELRKNNALIEQNTKGMLAIFLDEVVKFREEFKEDTQLSIETIAFQLLERAQQKLKREPHLAIKAAHVLANPERYSK